MKKFDLEFTVGLFILIGIGCLVVLSIKMGRQEVIGGRGYTVNATFTDVGGLRDGATVSIAGVSVGQVEKVSMQNFAAEVRLRLGEEIELPRDTIASIKTRGVIGEKYVELSPGGAPDTLGPGETITQTEPAIDLIEMVSKYAIGQIEQKQK
ncbi:outer membrane lipid asymmetry maintenance protein MlaD [Kiritimatiella glycovorans]|uniref:Putative phospholipid ABC transporter-binding protein MlaD n=1 Tax=Kiritimatiella glycovorans TaxID=1307763 RepID=A0A0G3EAY7_9BACT|nr:outer membrane lipid asymmetry maintenance protein MlaD [Kiritimatiella glycovorans]AKJ63438.1 putative phospholipid ABC transporter-binding protein MlaD [Kiritimatiella glycovorans]